VTGSSPDPEAAYYQTIEEFFVARRGDPLMISSADWTLIRTWRTAGIPVRIVLRGIADALDGHAHSWSRDQKVGSLRYCAAEVDAARERWERALRLGEDDADVPGALHRFASALEEASGLTPKARRLAQEIAEELRSRASGPAEARELEGWLGESEKTLLLALRKDAGEPTLGGIEAEVDAELLAYRARMPERILKQVREDAVARRLLEKYSLPRLSLFEL
jgi:hypothetical protein